MNLAIRTQSKYELRIEAERLNNYIFYWTDNNSNLLDLKINIPISLCNLLIVVFCSCQKSGPIQGQKNAVWSESIYLLGHQPTTLEPLTPHKIYNYAMTLKKNRIKYAYLFAGPYAKDGHLPDFAFSDTAVNSVKLLRKHYPEIVILPWVGGVQNKTVYLGDSLWVKNALADTKKLIDILGVPGVHVDLEFINPGEPFFHDVTVNYHPNDVYDYASNVNKFHFELRKLLPEAFISSVVVATSPDTKPWKRKTTVGELKILTKYIDQLSFLYYDTFINDQETFEKNCASLIRDIQLLRQNRKIEYLIAIGTFVNNPELQKYRNQEIESIPNTLRVIKEQSANIDPINPLVDGVALFCDWETDETEWKQFADNWYHQ